MPQPIVSILVTSYCFEKYLGDCLKSILRQKGSFEVIAIDDASTDNSGGILDSFEDPRLKKIIHPKNLGFIQTINEGIRMAQGKYLARIDGDDEYAPDFLTKTLRVFETHPDVGLIHGDFNLIDENSKITKTKSSPFSSQGSFESDFFVDLLKKNSLCAPTIIFKRSLIESAMPIPADFGFCDWYLSLEAARKSQVYFLDEVLANYRVHSSGLHLRMIQNQTAEPTMEKILEKIFHEKEIDEKREQRKQSAKDSIYATQYKNLLKQYFQFGMEKESKRVLSKLLKHDRTAWRDPQIAKLILGLSMGKKRYDWIKSKLRRKASPLK